jgi:hypothetical protein
MAAPPKRRAVRITHLNAATVPVEQALIARAEVLESEALDSEGFIPDDKPERTPWLLGTIAGEFRLLAEELHWRG